MARDVLSYAASLVRPQSLEDLLTKPSGFNLTTATPLQRAICRIADGLPLGELAKAPLIPNLSDYDQDIQERATLEWAVGDPSKLPTTQPAELYLLASIRSGKSLLASALSVRASQHCNVSQLGPGEVPRVSVVSTKLDLANVIYQHTVGRVLASPILSGFVVDEPTHETAQSPTGIKADSITLIHPSGVHVEIKCVAGSRAGASLVARWSAGACFDEFPRMVGAEEGVVNFDDARNAVAGRLLPGAQLFGLGSPWAPFGPAFEVVQEHWQNPSQHIVVVRGVGPAMNPGYWTPERCATLKERNLTAYRTDVLGEFADPESAMFTQELLEAVTREAPGDVPPVPGQFYIAAIDPATRSNAFTLIVLTRTAKGLQVVMARQWRGSSGYPLSPDKTLEAIAQLIKPYGVRRIVTDQWSADAMRDLGYRHGLYLCPETITASNKVKMFDSLQALVITKEIELPRDPELLEDLRRVAKRVTQAGVAIELPQIGGRHCDYAAALALAVMQPIGAPQSATPVDDPYGDPIQRMLAKRREAAGTWLSRDEESWIDL